MRHVLSPVATPRSVSAITGMVRIAPADDLAGIVDHHWIVAWDARAGGPVRQEVLPDPSVNLTLEPGGALLYGVGSARSVRELAGRGMVVATKFRPGGFSGFLPGPVSALTGRVVSLGDAFGADGHASERALVAAGDPAAAIAAMTDLLRRRRPASDPEHRLTMAILETMRTAGGDLTVGELAERWAISSRTMQRLFARHVGVSPKHVLRRWRLQRAVDRLYAPADTSFARLAVELGYSDQAHMAADFRQTIRRTPSAVAASRGAVEMSPGGEARSGLG
jgi:AraC-like DNA-binding protein